MGTKQNPSVISGKDGISLLPHFSGNISISLLAETEKEEPELIST